MPSIEVGTHDSGLVYAPTCPHCGDQNWVRLSANTTRVLRLARDTDGDLFAFDDQSPSIEARDMGRRWECAVCVFVTDTMMSMALDHARRVLLARRSRSDEHLLGA